MKVVTKNGRKFVGRLVSIDFRSNMILHESIAEIDPKFNCELNQRLDNSLDYKMKEIIEKQHLDWSEEQKKEYIATHYYFGSIMISGTDIQQVLLKP